MGVGVVCHQWGPISQLVLEEVPTRALQAGEVRIAIHAAGVNFPDVLAAGGKYQIRPELPFVIGMEAAGEIVEIGPDVQERTLGQRVMCWAWSGCYAEEVIVPATDTLPMPANFSYEDGAAFTIATSTAANALLQRGQLVSGESLLVHGAGGGVGLAAVEVGKLLGATVIATASDDKKLALARGRGAEHLINYTKAGFRQRVLDITAGVGVDVAFDTVGGSVFDESLRCLTWGGRLLVVGFASGEIPELQVNQALLRCVSVIGVRALEHTKRKPEEGAAYRGWMLGWAEKGHLRPAVTEVLPLTGFLSALQRIQTREARGRIVLRVR